MRQVRSLALSLARGVSDTAPSVPTLLAGSWMTTRTSVAVTPRQEAPPLSPDQAGAQGAEYIEKVWRGGRPNPKGHAAGDSGRGAMAPGAGATPPPGDPSTAPPPTPAPPVALVPRLRAAMIDS